MNSKRLAISLLSATLISFAFAVVFIRTPDLWPLMPEWMYDTLGVFFKVHTQEEASTFEFLCAWLLSFFFLVVMDAVMAFAWRWKRRSNNC